MDRDTMSAVPTMSAEEYTCAEPPRQGAHAAVLSVAELRRAVKIAGNVTDRKACMPVLTHVRLTARDGTVTLRATDLTTSYRVSIPDAGRAAFDVLVPLDALSRSLVGQSAKGTVRVDVSGTAVSLRGTGTVTLRGLDVVDWPELPTDSTRETVITDVPSTVLRTALGRVAPCMSADRNRAHLCAALLERQGGRVVWVTTDGHRLIRADMRGELSPEGDREYHVGDGAWLFPGRAIHAVVAMLDRQASARVRVSHAMRGARKVLCIGSDRERVVTSHVEGTFPPYRQVIPDVCRATGSMRLEGGSSGALERWRAALTSACASPVGKERSDLVLTASTARPGSVRLTLEDADAGTWTQELEANALRNFPRIGVNVHYLRDALEACAGASLARVWTEGELDPILLCAVWPDESAADIVVMPMRV